MLNVMTQTAMQEYQFQDNHIGLSGMIALTDTQRYPALGGCRLVLGEFTEEIRQLCIRLAQAMHYKSALHQLPLSGGKSVICIANPNLSRDYWFEHYAGMLNQLAGRYITAVDIGFGEADMNQLARLTPHVTGYSARGGDPSNYTALGVKLGMEAAVAQQLQRPNLDGLHIVIQGLGKVGYALVKALAQHDVTLTVTDTDSDRIDACSSEFKVNVVSPDKIYQIPCDIFSPCAQSYILNPINIAQLNTKMIIGAANNQLADSKSLVLLEQRNIFYAPDCLVNAGGLICCAYQYNAAFDLVAKVNSIYDLALSIFERAEQQGISPYQVCSALVRSYLVN